MLQNNVLQWPYILLDVLFAHRTAKHCSTGFTPFKLMYQREATLPIDLHHSRKIFTRMMYTPEEKNVIAFDDMLNISDL